MISLEGVIIICGWFVSLSVALFVVPKLAANRVCRQFGLSLIRQGDKEFYVPLDPNGEPVKVPIGVEKDSEGNDQLKMGYAPLAYTLPILTADYSALKIKMAMMGGKSGLSRAIKGKLQEAAANGDSGALEALAASGYIPKKVMGAIAVLKALGVGINAQTGSHAGQNPSGGYNPGIGQR